MSPEVCRSEPYNWKSDIWVPASSTALVRSLLSTSGSLKALGCVLYEYLPQVVFTSGPGTYRQVQTSRMRCCMLKHAFESSSLLHSRMVQLNSGKSQDS